MKPSVPFDLLAELFIDRFDTDVVTGLVSTGFMTRCDPTPTLPGVHVLLRGEGCRHGQNKTRRIYRKLVLQLCNKTPKTRFQ